MLPSCTVGGNRSVITINEDTKLDTELFTYFLNEAYYGSREMSDRFVFKSIFRLVCMMYESVRLVNFMV